MEIGKFIKQYKGKDLSKVPASRLEQNGWYVGLKYDGNYLQIHKKGQRVWMFTSSGKELYITEIADELKEIKEDFIIEAEFNNNSDGTKFNDRRKSSTGTARADFTKGKTTSYPNCVIHIFDVLFISSHSHISRDNLKDKFRYRAVLLNQFHENKHCKGVSFDGPMSLDDAKHMALRLREQGAEGAFAYNAKHEVKDKGRSNYAIKLKAENSAKMICVGAKESDTVDREWGALELQDEDSNIQFFGGLTDKIRKMYPFKPLKEVFEIRYESFTNGKYIQGFINDN